MEDLFSQEDINPDSAIVFAECIADFARVIKKMQDNNITLVINQQADPCDETYLKVSTKLTLRNNDSMDGVDVVVSENGILVEDDEFPFIDIGTDVCELLRCYLIMNTSRSLSLNWDLTLREFAEIADRGDVMKMLSEYRDEVAKRMNASKRKRGKPKSPPT